MEGSALTDVLLMLTGSSSCHSLILGEQGRTGENWPKESCGCRAKELARPPGWLLLTEVTDEHSQLGNGLCVLDHRCELIMLRKNSNHRVYHTPGGRNLLTNPHSVQNVM